MQPQRPIGLATNLGLPCMIAKARREAGTSLTQINTEDVESQRNKHGSIWLQPEAKAQTYTIHNSTVSLPENLGFIFH